MKRRTALLPLTLLVGLLALRLWDPAPVTTLRLQGFDIWQNAFPRQLPEGVESLPVVILDVDDASLAAVGQWPWPRTDVAELVRKTFEVGQAGALAFDMVFAEPDRTSPEALLTRLPEITSVPLPAETRAALARLPAHDDILARTMARYPVVAGFSFRLQDGWGGGESGGKSGGGAGGDASHAQARAENRALRFPTPKASVAAVWGGGDFGGEAGDDDKAGGDASAPHWTDWLLPAFAATRNLPQLENAAAGLGAFSYAADPDGRVRRIPLLTAAHMPTDEGEEGRGGVPYPALTVELLRVAQGASTLMVKGGEAGISALRVGHVTIPTDPYGRFWVPFRDPAKVRTISAVDVLQGDGAALEALRGSLVLLGTSAVGLLDIRPTPVSAALPGVQVHAQALEAMLTGTFLHRPAWGMTLEVLLLICVGALATALVAYLPVWAGTLATLGVGGAVVASSAWAFVSHGLLLDFSAPLLVLFLTYALAVALKVGEAEVEKAHLERAFGRYLSPDMVKRVTRNTDALTLSGEERVLTVMFSDIRGFTGIGERLEPHQVTHLLNTYLTPMTDLIYNSEGTLDKYIGDALMAFWNAPLDVLNHPLAAARTTLAMEAALPDVNAKLQAEGLPPLAVGIGLHTGKVYVGNMGSQQRFNYTAVGDGVNLAARLEGLTKFYGLSNLMSQDVVDGVRLRVKNPLFLPVDEVIVKGRTTPVGVESLLWLPPEHAGERDEVGHAAQALEGAGADADVLGPPEELAQAVEAFTQARSLYTQRKWGAAKRGFEGLASRWPTLTEVYLKRIAAYQKTPPPKGWTGAFEAKGK